jgi:hypothetical protein
MQYVMFRLRRSIFRLLFIYVLSPREKNTVISVQPDGLLTRIHRHVWHSGTRKSTTVSSGAFIEHDAAALAAASTDAKTMNTTSSTGGTSAGGGGGATTSRTGNEGKGIAGSTSRTGNGEEGPALQVGSWHCSANHYVEQPPRFTALWLLDKDADPNVVKEHLQAAQRKGYPVLLREGRGEPFASFAHSGDQWNQLAAVTERIGEKTVKITGLSSLRRFDPSEFNWAGMVEARKSDFMKITSRLHEHAMSLQEGLEKSDSFLQKNEQSNSSSAEEEQEEDLSSAEEEYHLAAKIKDLLDMVRFNKTDEYYFHLDVDSKQFAQTLKDSGITKRYPLFQGDELDYMILFVQPPGLGGAHIDDRTGATYFYLTLLEGRKVMRIWPYFEHGELEAWGCSQRHWNNASVPPELFLRGAYRKGFSGEHWAPHGFEYGMVNEDAYKDFEWSDMCDQILARSAAHVGRCFVEVEMHPGDEVFVPSGLPHQVSTLEPSLAISGNFRFTSFTGHLTEEKVQPLIKEAGMASLKTSETSETSEILGDVRAVAHVIIDRDDFDLAKWQRLERKHKPWSWLRVHPRYSSQAYNVVTNVLLSTFKEP